MDMVKSAVMIQKRQKIGITIHDLSLETNRHLFVASEMTKQFPCV